MDNTTMNKALISAQKCVLVAFKDGTNPAFKSKYATLDSVLSAIRGPLAENGFALIQDATSTDGSVSVVTKLLHESGGELVSQPLSAPLKKEFTRDGKECPPSVQQIGSLVTYLRRYSLCPFLGVSLDDDDDGNHASQLGKDAPVKVVDINKAADVPNGVSAGSNRKSAHTGEALNTPEAVARHKEAAAAAAAASASAKPAPQQPRETVNKTQPAESGNVNDVVANAALKAALDAACVRHDELAAYLRGEFGVPRITKPILSGSMGVASLGDRIVTAMLAGNNWGMVVGRIKADPGYLPF